MARPFSFILAFALAEAVVALQPVINRFQRLTVVIRPPRQAVRHVFHFDELGIHAAFDSVVEIAAFSDWHANIPVAVVNENWDVSLGRVGTWVHAVDRVALHNARNAVRTHNSAEESEAGHTSA